MLDTRELYAPYGGRNRLLEMPLRICQLTLEFDSWVRSGWEQVWLSTQWPCCLNRPGFGGGIDPTEGWSHVSTEEVSA
jgi:hypothetical protein